MRVTLFQRISGLSRRLASGVGAFLSAPASARPLAVLRVGLAAVLLAQAFALWGALDELYGRLGVVQWSVGEGAAPAAVPRLSWVVAALAPFGFGETASLHALCLLYATSLIGLLMGWRTRWTAAVAWLTHLAWMTSGAAAVYGADEFAHIALFYCVWMPVGGAASLDRLAGRISGAPTAAARLSLRVLQLHLCVVYFSSGVFKATGEQWRQGEAVWYALMQRDLGRFDFSWLAAVPWAVYAASWGTLILEIGYAFFVWPRWTRRLWAGATIGLHAGIAVTMGLWSFSALMMVLTTSAFLTPADAAPARVRGRRTVPARTAAAA